MPHATPETDREKALHMLQLACVDDPRALAHELAGDGFSPLEIAGLALAFEDGQSVNLASDVLAFRDTRLDLQRRVAQRSVHHC